MSDRVESIGAPAGQGIFVPGKSEVKVSISYDRQKHYDTVNSEVEGRVATRVGALTVGGEYRTGTTMGFEPDLIEAPGRGYLGPDGKLRDPHEPFEAGKYKIGYGAQFPVKDYQVTMGVGYANYHGYTPGKSQGLDAKDITIDGYSVVLDAQAPASGAKISFQEQWENYNLGYSGYTFFQNRDTKTAEVQLRWRATAAVSLKSTVEYKNIEQDFSFDFWGIPRLFMPKTSVVDQFKIQPGLQVAGPVGSAITSVELGPVLMMGEVIPSIISVPIRPENSLGVYSRVVSSGGLNVSAEFSRFSAGGTGDYYQPGDLSESHDFNEVKMGLNYKKFDLKVSYGWGLKEARFIKPTPLDSILTRFPDGASRRTSWDYQNIGMSLTYSIDSKNSVTLSGLWSQAEYDQYGDRHFIPNQKLIGLSYSRKF